MAMPRLDPSAPGNGPTVSTVVTTSVRDRVMEIATMRGVTRSAVVRELIERALAALAAEAAG